MESLSSGIQYRHWPVEDAKACVLLAHGLAEHTGRRSVPDVIGARHGHAALIKARSNMLVASGMLGKTMREQHAGLGVFDRPVPV